MNFANKQVTFHNPQKVSQCINEGLRALAERYNGKMQLASDHCVLRVAGLTEARLTRSRGNKPPRSTRDGQSWVTLIWVLLVDGMLPHRPREVATQWLTDVIDATDILMSPIDEPSQLITIFSQSTHFTVDFPTPTPDVIQLTLQRLTQPVSTVGGDAPLLPILNRLFVGREQDIQVIYERIGVVSDSTRRPLTIVRGWPGVGKTALVNVIAHDDKVKAAFNDGILWMSLGRNGNMLSALRHWAQQMGALHLMSIQSLPELLKGLRIVLSQQELFMLVDDVWTPEQGAYIKQIVDSKHHVLMMTTRFTDVANHLRDVPDDVYVLEALPVEPAVALLAALAPTPAQHYHYRMAQLARALEGLPLALRVAGPMLQYYFEMHFDIEGLIDEFEQNYNLLLQSTAPNDRFDEETGRTPTIELLFQRSVETLSTNAQKAFAALGVFKHKPATFNAKALQDVWEVEDPKPQIMMLIGRGLMDTTPDQRYRIHQTLHMYANKLLDDYESDEG